MKTVYWIVCVAVLSKTGNAISWPLLYSIQKTSKLLASNVEINNWLCHSNMAVSLAKIKLDYEWATNVFPYSLSVHLGACTGVQRHSMVYYT